MGRVLDDDTITFVIAGDTEYAESDPSSYMLLSERDARDLLKWLGEPGDVWGVIQSKEMAARCRRRLWPEARNHDPALVGQERVVRGVKRAVPAREAGFLRTKTEEMLRLCERADGRPILFS